MNSFFNSLNDITSELFIQFKELKNQYSLQTLKKTQTYFESSIDLMRIAELFTRWCPELFLNVDHVHSSRLLNFIMFILNSVFIGEIEKSIREFSDKVYSHQIKIEQFLAPMVGILVNISMGIQHLQEEESALKYETLTTFFEKTDAFNERGLTLLQRLQATVWSKDEMNQEDFQTRF